MMLASRVMPVLSISRQGNIEAFVDSWNKMYNYPGWEEFETITMKRQFTSEDLVKLFRWKNNMILSDAKSKSFENKIARKLDVINRLKSDFQQYEFEEVFGKLRTVWQAFLLHLIQPSFPLFDQHVYRAYHFIEYSKPGELPYSQSKCLNIYHHQYVSFFKTLSEAMPARS